MSRSDTELKQVPAVDTHLGPGAASMKELGPASVAVHRGSEATWGSPTAGVNLGQGTGECRGLCPGQGLGRRRTWADLEGPQENKALPPSGDYSGGGDRLKPSRVAEGRKRIQQFEPKFRKPPKPWDLSSMPSKNQKREISLSRTGDGKSQICTLCWGWRKLFFSQRHPIWASVPGHLLQFSME